MILPSKATLIGFAVMGILLIAALGTAKWQHHNAVSARAERDALKGQLGTAVDANASLVTTVDAQTMALKKWAALGKSPEEMQQLVQTANEREKTYERIARENTALKDKDRNLPDCLRLLQISLRERCPGRALVLRQYESGHENGSGGNPDSRSRPLSTRVDQGLRSAVPLPEG